MANQFGLARFRALTSGGALCVALCCLGPGQSGRASAGTVHHRPQRQGGVYAATFTTIDAPGAGTGPNQGTYAFSINTAGAITGYYIDTISVFHSFVRSPSGTLTTFDAPGAGTGAYQGTSAHSIRSEEHTSELQSPCNLVCRLLLEKKNTQNEKEDHRLVHLGSPLTAAHGASRRSTFAAVCGWRHLH